MSLARQNRICSSVAFSLIGSVISVSVSGQGKSTEALIPRQDDEKYFLDGL